MNSPACFIADTYEFFRDKKSILAKTGRGALWALIFMTPGVMDRHDVHLPTVVNKSCLGK